MQKGKSMKTKEATKATISAEIMQKCHTLGKKGLDGKTIADVLCISKCSVDRILNIMTAAENGDVETLETLYGKGMYKRQKAKACEIFGINPEALTTPEEVTEEKPVPMNNDAIFAGKVIELLQRQNELLEKLCAVWGVSTEEKE